MAAEEAHEWPLPLKELLECPPERDTELQLHVLRSGFDQGCFFRLAEPERLLKLTSLELLQFHGEMSDREAGKHPEGEGDPFEDTPIDQGEIEGEESGVAITTQRCDLIKSVQKEPLVEVAGTQFVSDPALISQARSGTASHLVVLCEVDGGAWIADLRALGHISKLQLPETDVVQPVPAGQPRRRVGLRIGARHSRDAVPASVSHRLRGLKDWLYGSAGRRELCEHFSEFMLHRMGDEDWIVIALIGDDKDEEEATRVFEDELIDQLSSWLKEAGIPIDTERCSAYTPEEISLALYQDAYKLDLDAVTYGSSSGEKQAEPAR